MRCAITALVLLSLSGITWSAESPSTQPTTSEFPSVLVLPFVPPNDGTYHWISASVQQDLASALAPNLRGRAIAPTTAPAVSDAEAALDAGRNYKASAVVFGHAQTMGKNVRVSGQVLDLATGKSLGSFKQNELTEDLFHLEDAIAPQLVAALPTEFLNFRGIALARQTERARVIYLPGDPQTPLLNNAPVNGTANDGSSSASEYPTSPGPTYGPPYSPYASSYPYRFMYPYAHMLYGYDPGPLDRWYWGRGAHRWHHRR